MIYTRRPLAEFGLNGVTRAGVNSCVTLFMSLKPALKPGDHYKMGRRRRGRHAEVHAEWINETKEGEREREDTRPSTR